MCFGSSGGTPKPVPTYPTRFAYNQPVPKRTQQQQVAAATTPDQPAFGSELGTPTQPTGG
jgi:hypothetical protein